ncbi:uncharacterized protein F5891DRAFT_982859 [Suillus fuscotomentosus]|uniref:Uncharacterized protein n=1 Tax=Suillus fuscotomentosus TaxID=1912939 RepID=A0AAD4HGZ0_9AGAM|nr:uncharacterized protein F5891DRAFT_982859 [Suillus fuscotomentosus]KAG1897270.1 hypothetical protein F5891DRAFT_982859 [Suillus fuscotomentosus]
MTRWSIISRREAATTFSDARSLPVDAASCAMRRDNLRRAVELVEQGHGQQWSLASQLRTPLEDPESISPEVARKFLRLRKCLSDTQGSAANTDKAATDLSTGDLQDNGRLWYMRYVIFRSSHGSCSHLCTETYKWQHARARSSSWLPVNTRAAPSSSRRRETPSCSLAVCRSCRSDQPQRWLRQGNKTRIYHGPKIAAERSNSPLANSMGRNHATDRQRPPA